MFVSLLYLPREEAEEEVAVAGSDFSWDWNLITEVFVAGWGNWKAKSLQFLICGSDKSTEFELMVESEWRWLLWSKENKLSKCCRELNAF